MTPRQPVRWMCLCESPGDVPPTVIPAGVVWVRLDSGHPAPATAETAVQQGDELNEPSIAAGSGNGFGDVT